MGENIKNNLDLILALVGVAGAIFGASSWYSAKVEKSYAAKRDFQHLKNNYEMLSQGLKILSEEQDKRFDAIDKELIRLTTTATAILGGRNSHPPSKD